MKMFVKYLGCSDDQASWGQSNDPRPHLTVGEVYELVTMKVHTWHTLYFIKGFEETGFNSVCFEELQEGS